MPNEDKKPVEPLPVEASTKVVTAEGEGKDKKGNKVKIPAGVAVNAAPEEPAAPTPKGERLTFDMYMQVKGVPLQRRPGMKAFTNLKEATLAEWTAAFRKY